MMNIFGRDGRLVILLSGFIIVIPMVIFPSKLGLNLESGSFAYALIEVLYYGIVLFIFRSHASLFQVLQGAGLTFLYRIVLGTVFGLFLAIMYKVNLSAALTLGVSRYIPAVLIHVIAAPFVMKPIFARLVGEPAPRRRPEKPAVARAHDEERFVDQPFFNREERPAHAAGRPALTESRADFGLGTDLNGFERAVRYLGEHHAVKLAIVVNKEGLSMAYIKRGSLDIENWAPLTLLLDEAAKNILSRSLGNPQAERMEILLAQDRLSLIRAGEYYIMALAGRDDDELLGVRLTQASEMVRRYVSERYGRLQPSSAEEKYVPHSGRS